MPLLLLKLTLTPLIVGGASLAVRRWGPAIGGWIVSLPLTSGPVLFFLALDPGPAFARAATTGTLLGLGAICGFTLGYLAGSRRGPLAAFASASAGFLAVGDRGPAVRWTPRSPCSRSAWSRRSPGSCGSCPPRPARGTAIEHPSWDLPARVIVGTVLVLGLTTIAPLLGPVTSGLVATFPVYVAVLAVFEHLRAGRVAALGVLRGLLTGLFGTVAFYVVIWALILPAGIAVAFTVAIAVTAAVGAASLRVVRSRIENPEPEPV